MSRILILHDVATHEWPSKMWVTYCWSYFLFGLIECLPANLILPEGTALDVIHFRQDIHVVPLDWILYSCLGWSLDLQCSLNRVRDRIRREGYLVSHVLQVYKTEIRMPSASHLVPVFAHKTKAVEIFNRKLLVYLQKNLIRQMAPELRIHSSDPKYLQKNITLQFAPYRRIHARCQVCLMHLMWTHCTVPWSCTSRIQLQ